MKKVKFQILKPLAHIINLSFSQGKIPDSLKIAKVVHIYKKGDYSLLSNYRPISILPAFSKILLLVYLKDQYWVLYYFYFMLMIYITFLNKFHVFNMLMTPLYMPMVKNYQM